MLRSSGSTHPAMVVKHKRRAPPRGRRLGLLLAAAAVGVVVWAVTAEGSDVETADAIARANVRELRARQAEEVGLAAGEFRHAWRRSDLGQVKSFLHEELHEGFWPQVVAVLQRRGWDQVLPELGDGAVSDRDDGTFDVRFPLAGGKPLVTRWMQADGLWRIGRLLIPPE
jgi:hypothetical protein